MPRKLRNSLNALVITAAVCATGAFGAASVPFTGHHAATAPVASAAASPVESGRRKVGQLSRIRHSLAMPYFSFVPRG